MANEKTYNGQTYDYDYMIKSVKLHPELKEKLREAEREMDSAKERYIEAKEDFEDVELEWHNHISEWKGFKPFEDKLEEKNKQD